MLENLSELGGTIAGCSVYNSEDNDWFVVSTREARLLCVPAICYGTEIEDNEQWIAYNFMVAKCTQKNIDRYYILTNQSGLQEKIKNVLPKLFVENLFIIETNDYTTISEVQSV